MVAAYDGIERRSGRDRRSGVGDRRLLDHGFRSAFLLSRLLQGRSGEERRSGRDRRRRVPEPE